MTVKEAFETILDGSYDILIDGVWYYVSDDIPTEIQNREIKRVKPRIKDGEPGYFIKLKETRK